MYLLLLPFHPGMKEEKSEFTFKVLIDYTQ